MNLTSAEICRTRFRIAALVSLAATIGGLAAAAAVYGTDEERGQPASSTDPIETLAPGIVGSAHDFSAGGEVARDLCLPCHTPHITAAEAPLLVGRAEDGREGRTYPTRAGALDAASIVCLSCHDGTVARDVYAGAHAMQWSDLSTSGSAAGATRVTNHPVGVAYPDGDAKYHSAAAVTGSSRIRLPNGLIQCTTCHDPHNTERHPGMLVISNDRSRLCLSCHRL